MSKPLFSIILPTRNRAQLLRRAITSILWQTLGDYELIVFDNASEDHTPAVVKEFTDPRIRYIRSEKWIEAQDSFEKAFKMAEGQFLHVKGDDDALLPHCLERAKSLIDKYEARLICFSTKCSYYYPDWIDERQQNSLVLSRFTSGEVILDSKAELKSIYEFGLTHVRHPIVMNAFFQKTDMDYLMNKYGRILLNEQMGDISIAVFFLHLTDNYLLLDEPLQVAGFSGKSNSANQLIIARPLESLSEEFQSWFSNQEKMKRFLDGVPLQSPLWINFQTATLLKQKAMLGVDFEINWASYFKKVWRVLRRLEAMGIDTSAAMEEFHRALSKQDSRVRLAVKFNLLWRRKKRRKPPRLKGKNDVLIRGRDAGFTDILGAARHVYECYGKNALFGELPAAVQ